MNAFIPVSWCCFSIHSATAPPLECPATTKKEAGVVAAPSYIPNNPSWKDDIYILDNSNDRRYTPHGGHCQVGSEVIEGSPCWSGSSYRSVGQLLGKTPLTIPKTTYPECKNMPAGRFLVDSQSGGGHTATLENGQVTDAARCAWDRFLTLY